MRRSGSPQYSHTDNDALFAERGRLREQLEAAEAELEGGDESARRRVNRLRSKLERVDEAIVVANTGLVFAVTRSFCARAAAEDAADFESAGMCGLWSAIRTFQPGKGSFSHWAHQRIKAEVLRTVKAIDHPMLSHSEFGARPEILAARERLRNEGLPCDVADVAVECSHPVEMVARVLGGHRPGSLDLPVGEDGSASLGDLVESGGPSLEAQALGAMLRAELRR